MLVPEQYRATNAEMTSIVTRHPFAVLTSNGADSPYATHLPALLDPTADQSATAADSLVGRTVIGHLNRHNTHWGRLQQGGHSTLIFQGPNSYVSPTVYGVTPAAPTWDFTVVHLRGEVEPLPADQTLAVVRATVEHLESVNATSWDMTDSLDYFRQLAPAVGAWRMVVSSAEGMLKLSQEQPDEVRQRVVDTFRASPADRRRELAPLIAERRCPV